MTATDWIEFDSREDLSIHVFLRGDVFELKAGGLGLCGEYELAVDAPFSPLHGGMVALSKIRKPTFTERKAS